MNTSLTSPPSVVDPLPLQAASKDIWRQKYCLHNAQGEAIDVDVEATFKRVAKRLAQVEADKVMQDYWYPWFLWALRQGALPAGRILSNAGAEQHKPSTSTINCTVSGIIADDMDDILEKNRQAGLTLKAGCGIGYEFSTLRPKGALVAGAGAYTSGPLSFMDIYDRMCATISSAGGRRGAQMATFDISHPDVEDFIRAKREDGRLRQFNLSLLIREEFIDAVRKNSDWCLAFPISQNEQQQENLDLNDEQQVVWRSWPITKGYIANAEQQVACRISKRIKARHLWNLIMASTYDFAEPGFILIDRVNALNNNWFCEQIRATNPCGEQPLPPHGSCLLGSINLTRFVSHAFSDHAEFDWEKFKQIVAVFTRMLDNVVDIHGLALTNQVKELHHKRRHGMGFLGLGSAMTMLGMRYGDDCSLEFTEKIAQTIALQGFRTGLELAQEKGPAPIMKQEFTVTEAMLRKQPRMLKDGISAGDSIAGKILWCRYSNYMQQIAEVDPQLHEQLCTHGCRFTHHSSIAPTGTIALSIGNNASNGIEPSFAHQYQRNIIVPNKNSKQQVNVYSYELLHYRYYIDKNAEAGTLPITFCSADDLSPQAHIAVQAAAQKWVDSSISKTINVATDINFEDFKNIYLQAADMGLKGCTTFRYNPEAFQGVLVKSDSQAQTRYRFTLEDGQRIEVEGDTLVEYEGQQHVAANLYEALKEGYYGKL